MERTLWSLVRWLAPLGVSALMSCIASPAVAAPAPPFTQCPPISEDPSCGSLIVVGADGVAEAFNDPHVGPFNGDNTLVGVLNESNVPVKRLFMDAEGEGVFAFDGDGICSDESIEAPLGCPFGPTGYEGHGVQFVEVGGVNRSFGSIEFAGAGLLPGASTYFGLEWIEQLGCGSEGCYLVEPTTLQVKLSGGGKTGTQIVVPRETPVTAQATVSGARATEATGRVEYGVYSDRNCTRRLSTVGTSAVSGGLAEESSPATLPPGYYFWQAAYYGDGENAASLSRCEVTIEAVEPDCEAAKGVGHLGPRGSEGLREVNNLSTSGRPHRFELKKPGLRVHLQALSSSACVGLHEFVGSGPARVNGVGGYLVSFAIRVTVEGVFLRASVEKDGVTTFSLEESRLSKPSKESFSPNG